MVSHAATLREILKLVSTARDSIEDASDRAERVFEDTEDVVDALEDLESFLDTLIAEEGLDKSP